MTYEELIAMEREDLEAEAKKLNIKFNPKLKSDKLADRILYTIKYNEEKEALETEKEQQIEEEILTTVPLKASDNNNQNIQNNTKEETLHEKIRKAKEKAFKLRKVSISLLDKRENDIKTTAYLDVENLYFNIARVIPLDTVIELEQCLIDVAKESTIVAHRSEIVDGKPTGNKIPVQVKKFSISYEE